MFRIVLISLLAALTAACATPQQNAALECGAGGAIAAMLLCKVAGGDTGKCAAIGAGVGVLGGAGCYAYSDKMARRQKELEGHENDLDARLKYVKDVNSDTAAYNAQLTKDVGTAKQKTDDLVAQMRQKAVDQQQLADQRKALDTQIRLANDNIALQRKQITSMRTFQAQQSVKSQELTSEIQRQQMLLAETERETSALAAQRQRI
ncbi:hypothetical protein AWB78_02121 [Caballeronia calidae]|uniref:Lipoprotein n=1 Tax=Caballeronia calidae TaxID=1777139 RepID=A0A158AZQ1_9BURK|nr:hypothetical protein [Caballeronia calidae]SAK63189.1 hypothetical protein AWB78_02121 [Caballeronia calidae]